MVTCGAPTPTTSNIAEPYSNESGISSINLFPRTLLSQIPYLKSGIGNELDEKSSFMGSHFYSS